MRVALNLKITRTIASKELRTYFLSPIALIFIATFLLASLFSFFWVEGFFTRNVADIRPLFEWLPVLLIFLVPALGMRLWSEEERMGTMELLRTLPLPASAMVLGKFLSALLLVAVALALTLPLPISVAMLGDLDWGPVVGGYLATLLLAGAYLAITLCVSAATASQIVALVFGAVACGTLYMVGADAVASLFGNVTAEVLRGIGAGSRFRSILRGVVDLRDVIYYLSLISCFLLLNVILLESRRWSRAPERRFRRINARVAMALVAVNLIALNVVIAPIRGVRLDLTENGEYSISDVTRDLLASLDEPLLIRGYFSGKTHPLLAPLVPRIRDMIEEYGVVGGDAVRAEVVDPTLDPGLEKEANQSYGIKSVPFQFADRHQASVVNSYFHLLIRYGDQYETLGFDDLIEVQVHAMDLDVRLRNLEYDLTRTIQKVVYGFQSVESVIARLPVPAELTAIVTVERLPEELREVRTRIEKVAREIAARSSGRFTWKLVDPDARGPETQGAELSPEELYDRYGVRPIAVSLFSDEVFYLHLVLRVGEHTEQLIPPESLSEADIREELLAALKRAGPGSLKTVGVLTGGEGRGAPTYARLREYLEQTYRVESVDLEGGRVPGDIDVLLLLDPRQLAEEKQYAIDQFLMRGGSAIIASGSHAVDGSNRARLAVTAVDSGLDEMLDSYGVKIGNGVVLDTESSAFPIPVNRNLGGFVVQEIQMLRYPAFVNVRGDGLDSHNPAVAGLPEVVLHWPSTVELNETIKSEIAATATDVTPRAAVLLRSSPNAWVLDEFDAEPKLDLYPELGWPVRGDQGRKPLAVSLLGPLVSYYKDREAPVLGGSDNDDFAARDTDSGDSAQQRRGNVIEQSPERSRLVVIGSASFVSDFAVDLSRRVSDVYLANLQLIQNLVDWCLEDVELLKIRSRGSYARMLRPTSIEARQAVEWGNYLFAIMAVIAIGAASAGRRKRAEPLPLRDPRQGGGASDTAKGRAEEDAA